MADKKISELDAITGSATAATDVFVVVDTSTGQTKKITREELNNAIEQDVLSTIDIENIEGDFSVNGNMDITGTVDGRDISVDGAKLDGIPSDAEANAVDSVNTQTGAVVLDADDISDAATTNKFTTAGDISKLAGVETGAEVNLVDSVNTQTGAVVLDADDISDAATTNKFTTAGDISKLSGIEALADVTDTANVTSAGAAMLTGATFTGDVTVPNLIADTVVSQVSINAQTGTTYTTVLSDQSKLVTLSNPSAIALTIPANSSVAYPVGEQIDLSQFGAGQVTVAGAGGVTINSATGLKLKSQYSSASCVKVATDTWLLVGDLEA